MGTRPAVNALRLYAHAMIHTAAAWDVLGLFGVLPPWWPPVSYVLAGFAIAAGCTSVLLAVVAAPRTPVVTPLDRSAAGTAGVDPAAASRPRVPAGGQLLALGILLAAWLLRGDAEIPPDVPLVAAEIIAAAIYAFFTLRHTN